jgi:DNA uptake protein ComE-like DNA-binding protein
MIRSSLIALLLCSVPLAQADTKKTTAPDKAAAADKVTEKATPAKPKPETKPAAKPEAKPAAKPAKPAAKPGEVDAADQALLDHAAKELKKLTPAQTASLLKFCNEGTPADLQTIPGIGEVKAGAIKKARPLKSADQLIMVDGVGEVTFDGVVKWVKDGMPKDAPTDKKPAAKPEANPAKPARSEAAKPEVVKPEAKTVEKKVKTAAKTAADKVAPTPAPK